MYTYIWCIRRQKILILINATRPHIYRPQTKAWTVRSRCQTRRWCSSKPDPPDLLQSSRRCPVITQLEARSRPTSHHMDPSDPPGHGNIGDWCSRAGWGQIVLVANRNGGMLRLIASRHDDDYSNRIPVKILGATPVEYATGHLPYLQRAIMDVISIWSHSTHCSSTWFSRWQRLMKINEHVL